MIIPNSTKPTEALLKWIANPPHTRQHTRHCVLPNCHMMHEQWQRPSCRLVKLHTSHLKNVTPQTCDSATVVCCQSLSHCLGQRITFWPTLQ
jgi:hypothetical protein